MKNDDYRPSSAKQIEADIAETRERMGETLEELAARLNPDRLKREAISTVREATIGRVETAAKKTAVVVRRNPIPVVAATATAAGIGFLVWRKTRESQSRRRRAVALVRRHLFSH